MIFAIVTTSEANTKLPIFSGFWKPFIAPFEALFFWSLVSVFLWFTYIFLDCSLDIQPDDCFPRTEIWMVIFVVVWQELGLQRHQCNYNVLIENEGLLLLCCSSLIYAEHIFERIYLHCQGILFLINKYLSDMANVSLYYIVIAFSWSSWCLLELLRCIISLSNKHLDLLYNQHVGEWWSMTICCSLFFFGVTNQYYCISNGASYASQEPNFVDRLLEIIGAMSCQRTVYKKVVLKINK